MSLVSVDNQCLAVGSTAILLPALLYALVNMFRPWNTFAIALLAAGAAALSMVLVFAPGRFIQRLAFYWGGGTLLGVCWLIGIGMIPVRLPDRLTGEDFALSMPLAALLFQAPLWALRMCFGWRWQREGDALANSEVHWSLKDLLAATALIALSLSLARLVEHDRGFWSPWIGFSKYAVLLSLFTIGPAMALTLRGWSWRTGALLFLVGVTLVGGVYFVIREGIGLRALLLPLPLLSFAVGLQLATLVARLRGYRLVCGHGGRAPVALTPRP